MSESNGVRRGSRIWRLCLRATRFVAVLIAFMLVVLNVIQLGVDKITLETANWQLWIKLGKGRITVFTHDETGDLNLTWRQGWNPHVVNEAAMYFRPKRSHVDCVGIEYAAGAYAGSPFV